MQWCSMLPEQDRVRLQHMLDAANSALEFAEGRQRRDLEADRMLAFALVRALEVVGEAAAQVSEATREALPNVPWRSIVRMRHRLAHAYFEVDLDRVWDTTAHSVPELATHLKAALDSDPPAPSSTSEGR